MGIRNDQGHSDSDGAVKARKYYESPTIERFGPVRYLTQGSVGKGDDMNNKGDKGK